MGATRLVEEVLDDLSPAEHFAYILWIIDEDKWDYCGSVLNWHSRRLVLFYRDDIYKCTQIKSSECVIYKVMQPCVGSWPSVYEPHSQIQQTERYMPQLKTLLTVHHYMIGSELAPAGSYKPHLIFSVSCWCVEIRNQKHMQVKVRYRNHIKLDITFFHVCSMLASPDNCIKWL